MISEQDKLAYRALGGFIGIIGVAECGGFRTREELLKALTDWRNGYEKQDADRKAAELQASLIVSREAGHGELMNSPE